MFGLESIPPLVGDDTKSSAWRAQLTFKRIMTVVERVTFTLLSVGVSILVPEFSSMMAFLGSFSAFVICVIGPISAKMVLADRIELLDALILVVASVMAVWGTVAAFWSP
jgi:vesicular inhibitory amino acid transporter